MKLLVNGYTVGEHMNIIRYGDSNPTDIIKEMNRLDSMIGHLKKNKGLYLKLVTIVAMMFISGYISPTYALATDVSDAVSKINSLGSQLLKLVRTIAYWTVLLTTSTNCIKEALNGDKKRVGNEVAKGVVIMAVIYFLPELFSMMESIVSQ